MKPSANVQLSLQDDNIKKWNISGDKRPDKWNPPLQKRITLRKEHVNKIHKLNQLS